MPPGAKFAREKRPYEHLVGHEAQALFAWIRLHPVEAKKKLGIDVKGGKGLMCNLEVMFLGMADRLRVKLTKVLDEPCGEGTRNEQLAAMYDVAFTRGRPGGALSKKKKLRLAKQKAGQDDDAAVKPRRGTGPPRREKRLKIGSFTTRGNAILPAKKSSIMQVGYARPPP